MIAYLEKYDTTVDIPDNASDKDVQDVNANFHNYVGQPETQQSAPAAAGQPATPAPKPQQQWQPNFYESTIKPSLDQVLLPLKKLGEATQSPQAQAFAGKTAEELSFGAAKPLLALDPSLAQAEKDHPAFADAGAGTGRLGSLLEVGGALRIAGLAIASSAAGGAAVEAGLAAGERFIPRAIMTGATFGTRTFIADTVKAFQNGGVNLEQFGKDVLTDTAFGATFGAIGGLEKPVASISSAGALGFLSSKMAGSDNREASLNAAIWAAFETVGSVGKSEALRMEALGNLKNSVGEYIGARNPDIGEKEAQRAASDFIDKTITKAGFDNAEDIAKSGPANLLEGIEKVNQIVRTAKIPAAPGEAAPLLPKLPAPVEPESNVPRETEPPKPQTPIEKAIDTVKGMMGIKPAEEAPKVEDKELTAFEQGKIQKASMEKGLGEIAERFEAHGIKPEEGAAIFSSYKLKEKGQFGQFEPLSDQINKPIEEQYQDAYKALATQRGLEPEAKPNAQLMDKAEKAVNLINGYFNPKSQEIKDFVAQHAESSDHDIAQMAYNRGLLEAPNPDLLKVEVDKAKQEKIISGMREPGVSSQSPRGQQPTEKGLQDQKGTGSLSEADQRTVFPGPIPSLGSIAQEPEYIKMRQKAAEIVHRYAQERGIEPSHKLAEDLFSELHDAFGAVRTAKPEERVAIAKEVMAKYPNLENDFVTLKDQLYSDKTEPYFDKFIKGQRYAEEKPIIEAQMAPSATMRRPMIKTPTVAAHIQESASEITTIVNPTKAAPLAAQITREQLGKMARSSDMAEAALSNAHDLFEKNDPEKNLDFIDRMERGRSQPSESLQKIADTLRKLLDEKRAKIQELGTGKLKSFLENYFPHIWDQGEKEVGQAVQKASKRPLEGQKSFLKKRSIEFTSDGVKMGLTPVSYNPVDLALLKMREMDKYIMAHSTIGEFKKEGLAQYVKVGDDAPEGWTKIDDRISTIFKSPMVAVKEAFDAKVMSDLNQVAENLGIDLERSQRMKGEGQQFKEAWGLSQSYTEGKPGKIWTKFAGPESALAHEIGHQIDHIYGFQDKFLSNPKIDKELSELANERVPEGAKQSFKDYVQQPGEKIAAMMEAYIHAPDMLKETAPTAYAQLSKILNKDPKLEPLTEIKPSLQLGTSEGQVYAGGNVIAGYIYAQPDAARIINNYLSPGLQRSSIYQAYRYAGNLINQFQLGLSAFHLGFTSVDSVVSKMALGLNQLFAGNPIRAVSNMLATPFAPITTLIKGNDLLNAWRDGGQNGSDEALAQAMATGGGRARMDQFYATKASEQMKHYFERGNFIKGIFNIPFSLLNISSKPILEYIVPRMKLGAFSDIMKMEMENNPNMTHAEMRELSQKAWDSIDNRLGQMVYDNLFWNRTFKDLLMASMRSVGWNIGTMRELAGGAKDYAEAVKDATQGKKSDFTYRMAYLTALPIVVGALGAMMQYIRTGKGPQEAKDYFFPKTGGVDEHGDPHRIALPSYMKDLYHYSQAPVTTVLNKLNPLLAIMSQMFQNKDFYGTKIRNEDDPIVKQAMSEVAYIAKQTIPFSIRNMMKNQESGNKSLFDTVGPWVGITPAPYDIDQTKAEKTAHEIAASHQEIGGRTEEQAERSRLVSDLTRQYRQGDPKAMTNIFSAYQQGAISHRQMQTIITNASLNPIQRMVKGMSLDEAERVYANANDEEKAQLETMIERKRATHEREFVAQ